MKYTEKRGRKLISLVIRESVFAGICRTDSENFQHSWRWMLLLTRAWRCSLEFIVSVNDQGCLLAGTGSGLSVEQNWSSCLHCPEVPEDLLWMPSSYLLQLAVCQWTCWETRKQLSVPLLLLCTPSKGTTFKRTSWQTLGPKLQNCC